MPVSREQRIRRYLDLVTGGEGTESVLGNVETMAGGALESLAPAGAGKTEAAFESARAGMESLARGAEVAPEQLSDLEAIIIPELRPVYDIKDGTFTTLTFDGAPTPGHSLWTKLTSEAALKQRIEAALPAIGRIELLWNTNIPYGGTGFVVGRNLLMTNRHVAQIFADGLGDRNLQFINGRAAGIDFKRDSAAGNVFKIRNVRMIHPYWDMAILEVEGLPDNITPLSLAVADARDMLRQEVVAIGYPAFDNRNAVDVQNELMRNRFQVKRLQPGMLQGGFDQRRCWPSTTRLRKSPVRCSATPCWANSTMT
ncbi:serine protease [Mesorhizobium sp. C268A]|uniref:trypsin-like serine peptidase n=2 Tax=unclassified Mesorhizobium TaxID=325217 RepID=UPI00333B27E2